MKETEISTLTSDEIKVLSIFKERVKQEFNVRKVILFGSRSRGDHSLESDIDLLVLVDEPKNRNNRERLSDIKFDVIMEQHAYLSPMLENYHDWENGTDAISHPLRDNILEEGIEIDL